MTIAFDVDSKATGVQRVRAAAAVAKGRAWVAASQLPLPGIDRRSRGDGGVCAAVAADCSVVR